MSGPLRPLYAIAAKRLPTAPAHFNSTLHLHYERIRSLLAKDCIRLAEVASRVGVSRQRVHELVKDILGVQGRIRACRLSKKAEAGPGKQWTIANEAAQQARAAGAGGESDKSCHPVAPVGGAHLRHHMSATKSRLTPTLRRRGQPLRHSASNCHAHLCRFRPDTHRRPDVNGPPAREVPSSGDVLRVAPASP
jgi:hypothetical protein